MRKFVSRRFLLVQHLNEAEESLHSQQLHLYGAKNTADMELAVSQNAVHYHRKTDKNQPPISGTQETESHRQ